MAAMETAARPMSTTVRIREERSWRTRRRVFIPFRFLGIRQAGGADLLLLGRASGKNS